MPVRTKPPFRADHVGSLIRPAKLIAARENALAGNISKTDLLDIQRVAIREVVKAQEDLGLQVVTDGEYNRKSWQSDFLLKIKNVAASKPKLSVKFHSATGARDHSPPTMTVVGKLARDAGGIFVDDFKFLKSVAKATPKVTLPSPNTSLSPASGSTFPPPLIQCAKFAGLAAGFGFGSFSTSQSPLPISRVACGKEATWPTWSPW